MKFKGSFFIALSLLFYTALLPCIAIAEGISGSVEFNYSTIDTKTEDASGASATSKTDSFLQRYNLNLEKTIYPYLRFRAGGIFEKNISDSITDDIKTDSTLTKINPQVDLTLRNPFYTLGVNYNRRDEKQESSGFSSATNIREIYRAIFGLKPEGLPSFDMQLSRTNTFDKERVFSDSVTDYLSMNLGYRGVKDLGIQYFASYSNFKDRLKNLEVQNISQTGKANYSRRFFDNRVSFNTNLSITRRENKTSSGGTGDVLFQVFPFSSLSAIDDTPIDGTLDSNPGLIDGNLEASSGIDIGPPPIGGDTKPRNIGLDFFNATEVSTIFVWVDRQIPSAAANSFSWEIYTSADNLNWSFLQTAAPALFGAFDNRFEINFSKVTARYIKVVTRPLSSSILIPPGVDISNIFVTEVQAFLKKSAAEASGSEINIVQLYDVNVRAILLKNPSLFYDFYYLFQSTDSPPSTTSIITNGLTLNHTFSRFFSGSARVARDDGKDTKGNLTAYSYSASLRATPLPTLNHSLVFSGRMEETGSKTTDTKSIYLYNYAELYTGININLSGGLSSSTSETNQKTDSVLLNFSAGLVPHRALTLNINYSGLTSKQSGGDKEDTSAFARRGELALTYTPFQTVYLVTSFEILQQQDRKTRLLQHYAAIWSPFRNGDLQFNFSFNDNFNSENNEKNRTITPSIRWNVTRRSYLDISYTISKSTSELESSEFRVLSFIYRMLFGA